MCFSWFQRSFHKVTEIDNHLHPVRYALKVTALSPYAEPITSCWDGPRLRPRKGFCLNTSGRNSVSWFNSCYTKYENENFYRCARSDALCGAFADVFFCTSRHIDWDRATADTDI